MDAETIKNSIECRWRLRQIKTYGWLFLIIPLFTMLISFFSGLGSASQSTELWRVIGWTTGYTIIVYSIVVLPVMLYNLFRYRELIKNYQKYTIHTVVLDKPHTSFLYKNCVYFTVVLAGHTVNTSPLFSDSFLSGFTLEEYAGKTVRVLYDGEKGKVYLIDKV